MEHESFTEGIDFYFDESGLMVFTKKYHLQRGYCCGNGCRHCPFEYENLEQPLRKKLLEKRESNKKGK